MYRLLIAQKVFKPIKQFREFPQERRDQLHKFSPRDHLLVKDNKTAQEILIGLCTPQSLSDLMETTRREIDGKSRDPGLLLKDWGNLNSYLMILKELMLVFLDVIMTMFEKSVTLKGHLVLMDEIIKYLELVSK